jgi:hypothetical protein
MIHDFPGYGFLSRCVHQGYVACSLCGPESTSQHSRSLKKVVYMGHCRWLRRWHPCQLACFNIAFDGSLENRGRPPLRSGNEVLARAVEYED